MGLHLLLILEIENNNVWGEDFVKDKIVQKFTTRLQEALQSLLQFFFFQTLVLLNIVASFMNGCATSTPRSLRPHKMSSWSPCSGMNSQFCPHLTFLPKILFHNIRKLEEFFICLVNFGPWPNI